ncbi:MAG: peptidase domain-containing ABC transporter [Hyphomicrobiaceae bacterium]
MQHAEQSGGYKLRLGETLTDALSSVAGLPRSVVIVSVMINLLGLALPLVILQVYDRVLVNGSLGTLLWLMVGLGGVIVLEATLKLMRSYLMSWAATKAAYLSEADAIGRVLTAPVRDLERESASAWMDRLDALEQFNAFKSGQSRLALVDLPFMALYLVIIYLVAGPLVFVVVAIVAVFAWMITSKASALRSILLQRMEHDHRRYDFITEALTSIEAIKSMAMEPQMQRRLERLQTSSAEIMFRKNLLGNELTTMTSLMTNVILIGVVSFGATMAIGGALSVGALACTTMLTSRLIQPIIRFIPVCLELESARIAQERSSLLFALDSAGADRDLHLDDVEGTIAFRDVQFSYSDAGPPLISIESLDVAAGEIIGIKGEQSIGKSTILKLISGELVPTGGSIRIEDKEASGPWNDALTMWINHVRHDADIFQGSILDNITMFQEGQIISKARAAAQLIGLEETINRLPSGYDTQLGSGASETLPAGLLQQITVARALAAEPKILLFDEANSLLDMGADKALRDGLAKLKGRMTQILISNRPSFLAIADHVFELRDGQLLPMETAEPKSRQAVNAA